MPCPCQQHDDAEGAECGQHIGDGVEHGRAVGRLGVELVAVDHAGHQAEQQKAHLRNGRESQHALEVGLRNCGQVTDQQGANRHERQHLLPVDRQRQHAFNQQAYADGECSELRCAADQQCDGSRRALVHVRQPHVEGYGTQLESQACNDKDQAEDQHLVLDLATGDGVEHLVDVERTGCAVKHRQTVKQEARSQRAQHKVFHGCFCGRCVVAAQRYQRIAAQGHELQAHVEHQEIVARDHHKNAEQGKQAEREELAAAQHVATGHIGAAIDEGDHQCEGCKTLEPAAHGVNHHHLAEAVKGFTADGVGSFEGSHNGQRDECQHISQGALR